MGRNFLPLPGINFPLSKQVNLPPPPLPLPRALDMLVTLMIWYKILRSTG